MNRKDAETRRQKIENEKWKMKNNFFVPKISASLRLCGVILLFCLSSFAQNKYENRKISQISITFEGRDTDV